MNKEGVYHSVIEYRLRQGFEHLSYSKQANKQIWTSNDKVPLGDLEDSNYIKIQDSGIDSVVDIVYYQLDSNSQPFQRYYFIISLQGRNIKTQIIHRNLQPPHYGTLIDYSWCPANMDIWDYVLTRLKNELNSRISDHK